MRRHFTLIEWTRRACAQRNSHQSEMLLLPCLLLPLSYNVYLLHETSFNTDLCGQKKERKLLVSFSYHQIDCVQYLNKM